MRNNLDIIHCFGDSHVSVFTGKDGIIPVWEVYKPNTWDTMPQFRTYRLGSFLAYSIGREDHRGKKILFDALKTIPANSNVLLIFGEIDCRLHLVKQMSIQRKPLPVIAADCVSKYFRTVKEISELGHKIIVFGGMPTGQTSSERNEAARLFDLNVKQECAKLQISCLSIFNKLVDKDGHTNGKYYMDSIHLSQVAMPLILEELKC